MEEAVDLSYDRLLMNEFKLHSGGSGAGVG
jgi:hypothetical protein